MYFKKGIYSTTYKKIVSRPKTSSIEFPASYKALKQFLSDKTRLEKEDCFKRLFKFHFYNKETEKFVGDPSILLKMFRPFICDDKSNPFSKIDALFGEYQTPFDKCTLNEDTIGLKTFFIVIHKDSKSPCITVELVNKTDPESPQKMFHKKKFTKCPHCHTDLEKVHNYNTRRFKLLFLLLYLDLKIYDKDDPALKQATGYSEN